VEHLGWTAATHTATNSLGIDEPVKRAKSPSLVNSVIPFSRQVSATRMSLTSERGRSLKAVVTAERIVFNIKGNDYRLVVAVDFEKGIVRIKWLGTHRDYDKIDVAKVKYGDK